MKALLAALIALVPGLFWAWFYLRKDRARPEPVKLIVAVFFWGAFATIPAIALEFGVDFFFPYSGSPSLLAAALSALLVIGPVEEGLKYLVIRELVARNPAFDEPVDAVIYAIIAALGFATLENILAAIVFGQEAVLIRFATATLLHAVASGIVGYHLALSRFGRQPQKKGLIAQGLVIAILLHGLYDTIASTDTVFTMPLIALILISMFVLVSRSIRELQKLPVASS